MLKVIASRTVRQPTYQTFSQQVRLPGYDRLTPKAARGALEVAFGNSNYGEVWSAQDGYGYRIYAKSHRKIRSKNPQ